MTARNGIADPIFSATLTPYRSLSPAGFGILMGFVGATCFGAGLLFWAIGAWPIVGFMGLDVLAIYAAFRLNYRSARAYEEIVVSRDELLIRKVTPRGRAREIRFNPYWVRLEIRELEDEGVTHLTVRSRSESVPVATFLNPDDRKSFAQAFGAALAEARR
ncbi:DUF2244 domain-containing protein [Propylenella binzhouense]|uniref:DUF2244 domain-containing protein n=1 Tax=Propylenella binzhouense TaxID=2555902 RepID=A0A964WT31_9HYPH|nr:DUF2244 domain-containing protein [Propylenella binzhouense]MYZ47420.1 DUF2244 domain-containing protein [Propylenella binzhouense]